MARDTLQERFERTLAQAEDVLFLCSGNILRSAFAELYARHLECPLPARSAATTYSNERIHPAVPRALRARGVALDALGEFRPRHVRDADVHVGARTLVLGMTRDHSEALRGLGLDAPPAFLLSRASGLREEIDDPFLNGEFSRVFQAIAQHVDALVAQLRDVHGRPRPRAVR